ncbi:centrosomal protein of 68 kDa isoform 2-T2 [Anableps anableps]
MHLSTFKHNTFLTAQDGGRDEVGAKGKREHHKSVTIAPTTCYLTDRHYMQRKPLFTEEHHVSILKMSHSQRLPEKEESSGEHSSMKQRVKPTQNRGLSLRDLSLPTASGGKPSSTLIVPELHTRLCHREPTSGLSLTGRSAQRSFSSSVLEVQSINPPLRPQLTSTVLHPTYTPHSRYARRNQTHFKSREGSGVEGMEPSSSGVNCKQNSEYSYQRDYWACAIPKALPPSPDRKSAAWNPDEEYEALLDYTYPLRPGHVRSEWNRSELQEDSLLRTDPNILDSGIELDHLCSSASLSGLEPSDSGEGRSRDRSCVCAEYRSPDLQVFSRSSDVPPCSPPLSLPNPISLSQDSLDRSKDRAGSYQSRDGGDYQHHAVAACSSAAFIRSTSVLPQSRWVAGEIDEEFWPLPEQLEELQQLSRQVREVAAQLSSPVTASCASLDRDTTSILSSVSAPQNPGAEEETQQTVLDSQDGSAAHTAGGDRDCEALRSSGGAGLDPEGGGLSLTGIRDSLVKQLCDSQEHSDSLMKHIQVFCSQLQLLIQQLYALSQSMEKFAAPAGDIVSVKASLADYQSFQKEVRSHQPLTSCVLHAGQHLLSCINGTSPFLRDMLLLIERQSGALQTHSDHVFSSVLSAMDSLAHHSSVQLREEKSSAGT